jgi:hypothetical protein
MMPDLFEEKTMQTHHILFVIWFAVVGVWLLNEFNRKNKK